MLTSSATPPGTARSSVRLDAEQVFEKLVRVPVVHRRRAAGARLAAAPGRSSCEGMRVHGARRLPRAAARGDARSATASSTCDHALDDDAPRSSRSCSTSSATRSTSSRRATRSAQRASASFLDRLPRRLSDAIERLRDYEFEDDDAAARLREPARGAREHPRARGVPAPLRRALPRARSRSTTSEALELMREMERLKQLEEQLLRGQPRAHRPRRAARAARRRRRCRTSSTCSR